MEASEWNVEGAQVRSSKADTKTVQIRPIADRVVVDTPVPDGWTVQLVPQWRGDCEVVAPQQGKDVLWEVQLAVRVRLTGPFRRVRVVARTTLDLSEPNVTVVLPTSSGAVVTVDGDVTFTVEYTGRSSQRPRVEGSAAVAEVRGSGDLEITSPLGADADGRRTLVSSLAGALRVDSLSALDLTSADTQLVVGTIDDCTLTVPGVKCSGEATGSRIAVDEFRSTAGVRNTVVCATTIVCRDISDGSHLEAASVACTSISDSTIELTETAAGAALVVGAAGPPRPGRTTIEYDGTKWSVPGRQQRPGAVTRTTITSTGPGDLLIGSLVDSSVSADGKVAVTDSVEGHYEENLSVVVAPAVAVLGAVDLQGGVLRGTDAVYVSGPVHNSTLDGRTVGVSQATSSELIGEVVTVSGALTATSVEASSTVRFGDSAKGDEDTMLTVHGPTEVSASFEGTVVWNAAARDTLVVAGAPRKVVVNGATEGLPVLKVVGDVPLIEVAQRVAIEVPASSGQRKESLTTIDQLKLARGAFVRLAGSGDVVVTDLALDGRATVSRHDGAAHIDMTWVQNLAIHIDPGASVFVTTSDRDAPDELPSASVDGAGDLHVDSPLARLDGPDTGSGMLLPQIFVSEEGRIDTLTGRVRLGVIEGLVAGQRARRPGRARLRWWQPATVSAPQVHRIAEQNATKPGHVVEVDPTHVPPPELAHVAGFHVFEPSQVALIDWAQQDRPMRDAREAAYKALLIADQVSHTAASGGVRSAAKWAAARTHHRALKGAPVEAALRFIHRLFGYSQRPVPPLATYLTIVFAITSATWWARLANGYWKGLGGAGSVFGHVALLPASWILRLPNSATDKAFFTTGWMNVATFLVAGLPLVFTVIALRNFMASPAEK